MNNNKEISPDKVAYPVGNRTRDYVTSLDIPKSGNFVMEDNKKTKLGVITTIYCTQLRNSRQRNYGLPTYNLLELKEWCLSQKKFHDLYNEWVKSGYDKYKKPSLDRKDDYSGYSFSNIQIVTWKENLDKCNSDKRNGINNKLSTAIFQCDDNDNILREWPSQSMASRVVLISQGNIGSCCRGGRLHAGGYKWRFKNK